MNYFCSVCKKDISEKVYTYSLKHFKKALCREHQQTPSSPEKKSLSKEKQGLSKHKKNYEKSLIKGRIAETLIEELFLSLGYNVYRYGMENTVPGIMKLLKGVRSDVAQNIRRMPDFVVQDTNSGDVYFIEVKFRSNETFSKKDIETDYPYENCYFVVVSKKHIKCITYKELMAGKTVSPKSQNYLGHRKEFELNKEVIIDFCNFATMFFAEV